MSLELSLSLSSLEILSQNSHKTVLNPYHGNGGGNLKVSDKRAKGILQGIQSPALGKDSKLRDLTEEGHLLTLSEHKLATRLSDSQAGCREGIRSRRSVH